MAKLSDLWKKGTVAPMQGDIPEGGLAIDVANKKAYSKASDGNIFEIGSSSGGIPEAPEDGTPYGRQDANWVNVASESHTHTVSQITDAGTMAYVDDAPSDSLYYARQDGNWAEVNPGGWQYQGEWTPTAGAEYPDATGLPTGSYWVITGVDGTNGYTFTGGDLTGRTAYNGDYLTLSSQGFGLTASDIDPTLYYRLDGTRPITADFQAGGFKLSNVAPATGDTDAVIYSQIDIGVY